MPPTTRAFFRIVVREMIGAKRAFRPMVAIGISVALTCLGLAHSDRVHCSRLDPEHPIALSNYFDARGFPFAWLATAKGTCGDTPGIPGVLWSDLVRSFALWAVATTLGGLLLQRRALRIDR